MDHTKENSPEGNMKEGESQPGVPKPGKKRASWKRRERVGASGKASGKAQKALIDNLKRKAEEEINDQCKRHKAEDSVAMEMSGDENLLAVAGEQPCQGL